MLQVVVMEGVKPRVTEDNLTDTLGTLYIYNTSGCERCELIGSTAGSNACKLRKLPDVSHCAAAAAIDVEATDLLLNFSMISTQDKPDGAASPRIGAVQSQQLDDGAMARYGTCSM